MCRYILIALACVLSIACGNDTKTVPYTPPIEEDTKSPPTQDNHAPVLHKIGDKIVQVGQTIQIVPQASDQDGDQLLFSVFVLPDMPDGATFTKSPPRFTWTPKTAGTTITLTFLVSDSIDSDSESVEITVVSENSNHAPDFQIVGDQVIEAGDYYSLTLQASDLDGDTLIFGADGTLPDASVLNGNIFEWNPPIGSEGLETTVRFTVTDGQSADLLDVNFFIVAPGQNKPPSFVPLEPQNAMVGKLYTLTLYAIDPDGDPLTFEMVTDPPEGSTFNAETHVFEWVPDASYTDKVHSLIFKVSDGNYSTLFDVDITVKSSAITPGECTNDNFESNNSAQKAAGITVGIYEKLSICDTELSPVDQDWFVIPLTVGQTLSIKTAFTHAWGDIDIAIYSPNDTAVPVAKGDSATDDELLTFKIPFDGNWYFRVFGVGQANFTNTYTLSVSTTGLGCDEDNYEENDNFNNAAQLEANSYLNDVQYCPGDPDVFKVDIKCGQSLDAAITFNSVDGDLNLALFRESNKLVAFDESKTQNGTETVDYHKSPLDETLFLKVTAHPPESTVAAYTLTSQISGDAECTQDEFEPNDAKNNATFATPPLDDFTNLTLCCNEDWFYIPLKMGDKVTATVSFGGIGNVKARLLSTNTKTVLAESEPSEAGVTLVLPSSNDIGNHYLVVEGDPGITYSLNIAVKPNDGCKTSKGCPQGKICTKATGTCVEESCENENSCPSGQFMPCLDGFCMDGCTYDADCRLSYACKGFAEGNYCGVPGEKFTGEACAFFSECKGAGSCYYKAQGGYCTRVGCTANSQCMSDSSCIEHVNTSLCAKKCDSNADCRQEDGYTCQPKNLPNGVPTQVCLPAL